MDLLIEKKSESVMLSDFGFYNIIVTESSPSSSLSRRNVKGRNGFIFDGVTFNDKTITVSARIAVKSLQAYYQKVDDLSGYLYDDVPFYITKMVPTKANLYDFELPGQREGDFLDQKIALTKWHYRHQVVIDSDISFSFIGKSYQGLKYDVTFTFVTAELPYGETIPKTITLSGGAIPYSGTAKLSQLEWPFVVEMTSNGNQAGFYLEIDGKRFTYSQTGDINSGDVFKLTGIETRKNGSVVNNKTNYAYFELSPKRTKEVQYTTNFNGTIKITNFVELYQ
ncbi:phage tail domain-containing protein [Streptococcus hyovaginalis]|uniref:phage tail domain-containing protein n=1 Tax=Streptococcus hyovaginalis TaxID=149015 RepID=UPI001478528D|nr:phage tail domain-containing protein [Streptococcus hyovaginalis]